MTNKGLAIVLSVAGLLTGPSVAIAQESAVGEMQAAIDKTVGEYCRVTADPAAERRMALQTAALKDLEARVNERISLLEQRSADLKALLKQRDELRNLAERELVDIYAAMDPGVAAQQMEKVDARLASSVLRQLKPRQASLILNEMKPELAARMVRLIASAAGPGNGASP